MITMGAMQKLRRMTLENKVGWDNDDLDRVYGGQDVLQEDLQDYTLPMVLLGTDVKNLYPSLDITQVVGEVEQAIMDSDIKWEAVDYLEAARYVAMNWTETQCRQSGLWRILPTRRFTTVSRPGLRGKGPQGGRGGTRNNG